MKNERPLPAILATVPAAFCKSPVMLCQPSNIGSLNVNQLRAVGYQCHVLDAGSDLAEIEERRPT
jgi:hypothetical protein